MSKRDPEKFDRMRGRHKKNASPESQNWNNQNLNIPRPPKPQPERYQPSYLAKPWWMDEATYVKLRSLRREVSQ